MRIIKLRNSLRENNNLQIHILIEIEWNCEMIFNQIMIIIK